MSSRSARGSRNAPRRLVAEQPEGVSVSPIYQQHKVVDAAVTDFLISLALSVGS